MNRCLPKGMSQGQIGDMDNPAAYFAIIPHFHFSTGYEPLGIHFSTGYEQGVNATVLSPTCF